MKYAVIVTYVNGSSTGATLKARSNREAWEKVLLLFNGGQNVQGIQVSAILTEECGGEFEFEEEEE